MSCLTIIFNVSLTKPPLVMNRCSSADRLSSVNSYHFLNTVCVLVIVCCLQRFMRACIRVLFTLVYVCLLLSVVYRGLCVLVYVCCLQWFMRACYFLLFTEVYACLLLSVVYSALCMLVYVCCLHWFMCACYSLLFTVVNMHACKIVAVSGGLCMLV